MELVNFSGELQMELFATCTSLNVLKLCNNQFTGTVSGWIGNMTIFSTFVLSKKVKFLVDKIPFNY
jgi:fluoride ion exporter CrcB/FEX